MTYLRIVLVLVGLPSAIASMAFALWDGPPSYALTLGGVAAVSVVSAWLLGLKADSDMERYKAGREDVWARRMQEAKFRDSVFDAHTEEPTKREHVWERSFLGCELHASWSKFDDGDMRQLPERFDAG